MSTINYDYIIVGAGAAGLNLALAMYADSFFEDKTILILDKELKAKNDRTWSFWEIGKGKWDHLITKSWNKGIIKAKHESVYLDLKDYNYKTLRSIDFYTFAKRELKNSRIDWKIEEVQSIVQKDTSAFVVTSKSEYEAEYVFDSRIPPSYTLSDPNYLNIAQHFKGWIIEATSPEFDDSRFTMMDFGLKDGKTTSFTYILPLSPTQALVEFTYFSPNLVSESTYDDYLKAYISSHLEIENYTVSETEKGVIPMTNFPFQKYNQNNIIKIGTAGGWVKASSGYSFKNCERKSLKIIDFIKSNQLLFEDTALKKYKHYDEIFLEVLTKENQFGEELFYRMYKNNSIQSIFRFLDEESSFLEDFKIILSLNSYPFIKGFLRYLKRRFKA